MDEIKRLVIQVNTYSPVVGQRPNYLPGNNRARMMAELMRVDHFREANLNTFKRMGFVVTVDGKEWQG